MRVMHNVFTKNITIISALMLNMKLYKLSMWFIFNVYTNVIKTQLIQWKNIASSDYFLANLMRNASYRYFLI